MSVVRFFAFNAATQAPECGITLAAMGPMKPGKDDDNRARAFRSLGIAPDAVLAVRQVHSRVVRVAESASPFASLPDGDGIITRNPELVPSVTVADCMPIWIFDPVTGCFGVLHSGWKGTGILRTAVELARDEWGAKPADFRVILGPHIRDCCYTVDRERAEYFERAFGPSCVALDAAREAEGNQWPYRLSLAVANRSLAASIGIRSENIVDAGACTSCEGEYGSNRREGPDRFTHMAAFIRRRATH